MPTSVSVAGQTTLWGRKSTNWPETRKCCSWKESRSVHWSLITTNHHFFSLLLIILWLPLTFRSVMTFLIRPKKYRNWSVRSGAVTPNWIMLPPGHPQPETWIRALPGLGECHIKHDCCQKVSTVLWNILTLTLFFLSLLLLLQPHISLTLENYDLVKIGAGLRSALKFSHWVSPFPKASHWSWHHFLP